jgi:hypothetical protein
MKSLHNFLHDDGLCGRRDAGAGAAARRAGGGEHGGIAPRNPGAIPAALLAALLAAGVTTYTRQRLIFRIRPRWVVWQALRPLPWRHRPHNSSCRSSAWVEVTVAELDHVVMSATPLSSAIVICNPLSACRKLREEFGVQVEMKRARHRTSLSRHSHRYILWLPLNSYLGRS